LRERERKKKIVSKRFTNPTLYLLKKNRFPSRT
jgi:hypothetical protein